MEYLQTVNLEIKAFQEYEGKVIGYGAYYNNIDRVNDIILPNAFAKSIVEHKSGNRQIPLLEEHKNEIIWAKNIEEISEDENGLRIQTYVSDEKKSEFKNILDKKGMSVGYITRKSYDVIKNGKKVRIITEADLLEVSLTKNPANEKARAEFKNYKPEEFKTMVNSYLEGRETKSAIIAGIETFLKEHGENFSNGNITHGQRGYFTDFIVEKISNLSQSAQNQNQIPVGIESKSASNGSNQNAKQNTTITIKPLNLKNII